MPSSRKSPPRRRPRPRQTPASETLEELQHDLDHLRALVSMLQQESAGHVRRCAELQQEVNTLKKRRMAASFPPVMPPTVMRTRGPF